MNKTYLQFAIILILFAISFSQPLQQLAMSIDESKALQQAQWSVYAEYMDNGKILVSLNSDKSLVPASGLKLITSAAALDYLGKEYRYHTKIFYYGAIKNGVLKGDIVIQGSGDPTLGSGQAKGSLPLDSLMMSWHAAISSFGIESVNGNIIVDDHIFDSQSIPDFWNWRDIGNYYAAGVSGLTIYENLFYLVLKPGSRVGSAVSILRTDPLINDIKFNNTLTTAARGTGDNAYLYAAPNQYQFSLRGTIPKGKKEFKIKGAIPNPPLFAAQQLREELRRSGVPVSGNCLLANKTNSSTHQSTLITETISPPLKDIIFMLNKRSINLYAEQLVKTIAVGQNMPGSFNNGLKLIRQFLENQNIPLDGVRLHDGSGLSRTNTITTHSMVTLLKVMFTHPEFESFYKSLGIAGDPDDISFFGSFGRGTSLEKNARIKSGLIPNIRSHSGYLQDRSGRWIAFSLIANNYNLSVSQINKKHLKILKALADLK